MADKQDMRALVLNGEVRFQPRWGEPALEGGDCLLRVRQGGISAVDLQMARGGSDFCGVMGHEFVAEVVAGPEAELVGRRVVGESDIACGRCDMCMSGLSMHCRGRCRIGVFGHDGALADLLRLPGRNLHVLPDSVDDDQAVFVEPLAAAMQVLKQIRIDGRRWVTVLGDGRLGLLCAQVLRNAGCPVRVVGTNPTKLALCEKWSIRSRLLADIVPRRDQDVVVECTGKAEGFALAMQMTRPRGTIVVKSAPTAGAGVNITPLVDGEISVIGSRGGSFREAIRALAEKEIDVVSLIHRRMKLEQGVEALELAGRRGVLKVLLVINS